MPSKSETRKIVAFVREQREHAHSRRHWKRRLAAFGFAIEDTEDGPMISMLPKRRVICPLPQDLHA
jgi:hypothetical protein